MTFLDLECLSESHVIGEVSRTNQVVAGAQTGVGGIEGRNRKLGGVELVVQVLIQRTWVTGQLKTGSQIRSAEEDRAQAGYVGGVTRLLDAAQRGGGPLTADIGKKMAHAPTAKDRFAYQIIEVH